jgi:dipeptidase D
LEVLITVDEETGMTGANQLTKGWLKGRYLLNLDSEEDGCLTIGCAGGLDTVIKDSFVPQAPPPGKLARALRLSKLQGGHSGIQIAAGRFNAIRVLVEILQPWIAEFDLQLAAITGGEKRNAIPAEANAIVFVDPSNETALRDSVVAAEKTWALHLGPREKDFHLHFEPSSADSCLSARDTVNLLRLLLALPHGVEAMSAAVPGFVESSANLAIVSAEGGNAIIQMMSRGSSDPVVDSLRRRIEAIAALAGYEVTHGNYYPGWKPVSGTAMEKLLTEVHQELFGKPMHVYAVHAGLECGIIGSKYPGMEMISLGPTIEGAHTPEEHVSISSVDRFWKLLVAALGRIPA